MFEQLQRLLIFLNLKIQIVRTQFVTTQNDMGFARKKTQTI